MFKVGDRVTARLDRKALAIKSEYNYILQHFRDSEFTGVIKYITGDKHRAGVEFPIAIFELGTPKSNQKNNTFNAYGKGKEFYCVYLLTEHLTKCNIVKEVPESEFISTDFQVAENAVLARYEARPWELPIQGFPIQRPHSYVVSFDPYKPELLEPIDSNGVDGEQSELTIEQKTDRDRRKVAMFGLMYGLPKTGKSYSDAAMAHGWALMAERSKQMGEDYHQTLADQLANAEPISEDDLTLLLCT